MNDYPDPEEMEALIAEEMARVPPDIHQASSAPLGVEVIDWRSLTDDDAPAAWARLREWVEWFTVRYHVPISTIPPCWWKHPVLVEELSALYIAHRASFDPSDTGLGPITWHEKLTLTMPRLTRAYAGGCSRGHNTPKPRSWANETDEQEWDAWTNQSHAH